MTACFESFAHGANDVSNAIGPVAVIYTVYRTNDTSQDAPIEWWILALGGVGIVVGLSTYGYRVIKTVGTKLTKVTPSRGFNIELGTSLTVLLASRLGIPVSTTQCVVGAVAGVGLVDGIKAVNWKLFINVFISWLLTLPIAGAIGALTFSFLRVVGA